MFILSPLAALRFVSLLSCAQYSSPLRSLAPHFISLSPLVYRLFNYEPPTHSPTHLPIAWLGRNVAVTDTVISVTYLTCQACYTCIYTACYMSEVPYLTCQASSRSAGLVGINHANDIGPKYLESLESCCDFFAWVPSTVCECTYGIGLWNAR